MNIITLSNGKRVANFSSPHPFTFEDGSVLPAVSDEIAQRLAVKFIEDIDYSTGDIKLDFDLTENIIDGMQTCIKFWNDDRLDVVLCPLPMITAIKKYYGCGYLKRSPFRAVRITDRIKKLVSITYQCL